MKLLSVLYFRQFCSYFCVGGVSAIVEWTAFASFENIFGLNYIVATFFAFIFSTFTNLLLGRLWTFKNSKIYKEKKFKEAILIFEVSAIGLSLNFLLMYFFVSLMKLNTTMLKILSKIFSTGIVFIWNFLMRRFVIYKFSFL